MYINKHMEIFVLNVLRTGIFSTLDLFEQAKELNSKSNIKLPRILFKTNICYGFNKVF